MTFISELLKHAASNPNAFALSDCTGSEINYERLASLSGRVYGYLKAHGIGREDFINILLPRGVEAFIAIIGVWRAGAAFVMLEEGYPAERVSWIQRDCGCKLVLDYTVWQEIQAYESLSGYEEVDDHQAAFAVYTSGSTGNPKGVLHEYGNVDRIAISLGMALPRFGLIAPLNFVASVIAFELTMHSGGCLFVIPNSMLKNPPALVQCFVNNNITETFCAPSIYHLFCKIPSLRMLLISSEPAYGIWSEDPKLEVYNLYAMSESGVIATGARLDAPNETAPIGQPRFDLTITLRDEDGNAVPEGQAGEICLDSPYVRGYINLPEQNARAFVNGEYRTGDLGKRLPNGDYVVLGRIDDMIKINGNRVEPAEVENAARRAAGLKQVIARGFIEGKSAFICLYYADDVKLDADWARTQMSKLLPYYMIPSHFIRMEALPRTQSGKLSRRLLPKPDMNADAEAYVAPATPQEEALCNAMAKVLCIPRVGAEDDFYALGGSSITSMEVVSLCDIPELNATQIFRGRTPRKIAVLCLEERLSDSNTTEQRNREAMSRAFPLTEEQRYMFDYQLYTPKSTMLNIAGLLLIKGNPDAERFCAAVNAMIQNHPALMTTISFNDDGELEQRFTPEHFQPVEIEAISEEQLEALKHTLVKPFTLIGQPLFRSRLFKTELGLYWFYDVHHMFFDGTSGKIMLNEICNLYLQETQPMSSGPDDYFLMLRERELLRKSAVYAQSRDYFERRYGGVNWSTRLECEQDTRNNRYGDKETVLDISADELEALMQQTGLGKNGFFMVAELLAMAALNGKPDVMVAWVYKGRDSKIKENILGLLFRELPAALSIAPQVTLGEVFADILDQIRNGISHSDYPFIDRNAMVRTNDYFYFIYQEDNWNALESMPLEMDEIVIDFEGDASQTAMDVQILDTEDGLVLLLDYSIDRYLDRDVARFMDAIQRLVHGMLSFRDKPETTLGELFEAVSLPFPNQAN